MIKIKKGTDVNITWNVLANENINTTDYVLEITDSRMNTFKIDFNVEGGQRILAKFRGSDQKYYGIYSLTLWHIGDSSYCVDKIWAFELVAFVGDEDKPDVVLYDKLQTGSQGPKGDKGDPFIYEDFTAEQIAELLKPAVEAAESVNNSMSNLIDVSQIVSDQEASRVNAESDRNEAEKLRDNAEAHRNDNEQERIEAEDNRMIAEGERDKAEKDRKMTESNRDKAEKERASAELERKTAEQNRAESEVKRAEVFEAWETEAKEAVSKTNEATDEAIKAVEAVTKATDGIADALAKKLNMLTTSEDLQISAESELSLTEMAKKRLFIDMWDQACGVFGRYNAQSGFFELNGLTDITYKEAIDIFRVTTKPFYTFSYAFQNFRTNIFPFNIGTGLWGIGNDEPNKPGAVFRSNKLLEVAKIGFYDYEICYMSHTCGFIQCPKLRKIIGVIRSGYDTSQYKIAQFTGCFALEEVQIMLSRDTTFADSPNLSLGSLQFMVENNENKNPITVTVHPEVYEKITDPTNTEWHQILLDAAEKNIQFATT